MYFEEEVITMERIDNGFSFETENSEKKLGVSLTDFLSVDDSIFLEGSETQSDKVELLSFDNIVPKTGLFLGLDISKSSTGVCIIENGEKKTFNISLNKYAESIKNEVHIEVLLRRRLKDELKLEIEGKDFDVVIIEDAFVGENPKDARLLFALNTAIDELLLEKVCSCKTFLRVENGKWKSWLWKNIDSGNEFKGLNDKIRIQECLYKIGVVETGEGLQDRLDATGMLVGYFLQNKLGKSTEGKKSINWGQIGYSYVLEEEFLFEDEWLMSLPVVKYANERVTKKYIKEKLESNPLCLFISQNPVKLGFLGEKLGVDYIEEGGYFAFWLKKKYRKAFN